ncbi:MAG: M3 family metallopeptidase [Verrucomicrobiota bacterium]|nr:M3 family metallopeptidase [Verrucomicrobiota bacterium]
MAHPFLTRDFEINWNELTPEQVQPDITAALAQAQSRIDAVAALPDADSTFESTFLALEKATEPLSRAWGLINHLDSVNNAPALREAYNAMLPAVSLFYAQIPLNPGLWRVLKAAADKPETQALTGVKARFRNETLADFREAGADLPAEKQQRLLAIEQDLARITQKYSENTLDSLNAYELLITEESKLAGLPDLARQAALQSARSKNLGTDAAPVWRFTLHAPSFSPAMEYLDDASIRERLYRAYFEIAAKAPHDNTPLIREILALRAEKAALLGKSNFADVVTERRMARNGGNALAFIERIHSRIHPAFHRELGELEAHKATLANAAPEALEPWDFAYINEKLRRARYDFDSEALRPYFSIDRVIAGLFTIAEKLFEVQIIERTGETKPGVWHQQVKFYEMRDKSGRHLGSFYADWHPRESKRGGAWMGSFITGEMQADGQLSPHLGVICGNLTAPLEGKPALLTHDEVTTIFHEFGHLIHHLLGTVEIRTLNGTNVAWDFVELPSQILENWCWERASLDLFARHYQTGDAIPEDLFHKMLAARTYGAARATMRQLLFGKMDLELHLDPERIRGQDLDTTLRSLLAAYRARTKSEAPFNIRNFGHLFSSSTGYAAGYYSYKWAEVLEADCFTRFLNEGVLNPATGASLRDTILSKGNSAPPETLFRAFMGRDPDPDALLRRDGLLN